MQYGWLDNPPVFDLLEIEYDCPEKEAVRTLIVNATTAGSASVTAFVNVPDKVSYFLITITKLGDCL